MPEWRNWQTHGTQNPAAHKAVSVRPRLSAPKASELSSEAFLIVRENLCQALALIKNFINHHLGKFAACICRESLEYI